MIPHYAPPYGFARAVTAWLSPTPAPDVADLERAYTEHLGVADAVILPSVRAGILMLIKAAGSDGMVIGPAYTCMVVHEAMVLSGARVRYVEPAPDSYSMSIDGFNQVVEPGACVVLSEMYGLPCDAQLLLASEHSRPRIRILDMAMGIPDPDRLKHLHPSDVALFSFGFGKSLCAGGGGLACFNDRVLANTVREMRQATIVDGAAASPLKSDLKVLASMAVRTRALCGITSPVKSPESTATSHKPAARPTKQAAKPAMPSHEWTHVMSGLERRLALRNLRHTQASATLRREQAEVYVDSLKSERLLRGVDRSCLPQSHFPIRVQPAMRDPLKHYLRQRGFDAGDEFPQSGLIARRDYPAAVAISDEVVTLPMGEQVSLAEIRRLSQLVIEAVATVAVPQANDRTVML